MSDGLAVGDRKRKWHGLILTSALLLAALAAPAAVVAAGDLDTVSVVLDREDLDARSNAYRDGLNLVLIRVTGSEDEQHLAQLSEIFAVPDHYVLRHRPGADNTLEVNMAASPRFCSLPWFVTGCASVPSAVERSSPGRGKANWTSRPSAAKSPSSRATNTSSPLKALTGSSVIVIAATWTPRFASRLDATSLAPLAAAAHDC